MPESLGSLEDVVDQLENRHLVFGGFQRGCPLPAGTYWLSALSA
jgi:hypothetical protein